MKEFYERYWLGNLPKMKFFGVPPTKEQSLEDLKLIREWRHGYKILDYGCGEGHLVGAIAGAEGVDISHEAVHKASFNYPHKYFYTLATMPDKVYHNIVASDVFEHIFDFDEVFDFINKHMIIGGRLLIATNEICLAKMIVVGLFHMDSFFDPYSPHIRFFTRKSLQQLLEYKGYRVIHFEKRGSYAGIISKGLFCVAGRIK